MSDNVKTRDQAARDGDVHYTGPKCKRGHDGIRFVSSGACVVCVSKRTKRETRRIRKLRAEGLAQSQAVSEG